MLGDLERPFALSFGEMNAEFALIHVFDIDRANTFTWRVSAGRKRCRRTLPVELKTKTGIGIVGGFTITTFESSI